MLMIDIDTLWKKYLAIIKTVQFDIKQTGAFVAIDEQPDNTARFYDWIRYRRSPYHFDTPEKRLYSTKSSSEEKRN